MSAPVDYDQNEPLTSTLRPQTNAILTIRIIKSISPYRSIKAMCSRMLISSILLRVTCWNRSKLVCLLPICVPSPINKTNYIY